MGRLVGRGEEEQSSLVRISSHGGKTAAFRSGSVEHRPEPACKSLLVSMFIFTFTPKQNIVLKSVFKVHYSSPKTKSFRQCPFEFCQARFTLLKDLKVKVDQHSKSVPNRDPINNFIGFFCIPLTLSLGRISRITRCKDVGILKISSGTLEVIRNGMLRQSNDSISI